MGLTDKVVKAAKPRMTPYKVAGGASLLLLVTPAGGKLWRFKYCFGGKEKQLALGIYPTVSLAEARIAHDRAKAELRTGRDPSIAKKIRVHLGPTGNETFKAPARDWHTLRKPM